MDFSIQSTKHYVDRRNAMYGRMTITMQRNVWQNNNHYAMGIAQWICVQEENVLDVTSVKLAG